MKSFTSFPYDHVLVLGLAKSGLAASKLCLEQGKKVRINDISTGENDAEVAELNLLGAEMVLGSHPLSVLDDIEVVVKNPGIPYENPIIVEAEKRNIPIITEIELAGQLANESIIGITGSNGKTTVTMLITEILKKSEQPAKIAGNIGVVASDVVQTLQPNEQMVMELSSFQLLGTQTFKPKIAVLLNIFEAHLDYHKTFENYRKAKSQIFLNQTEEDYLVYNHDEKNVKEIVKHARSTKIPFSLNEKLSNGAWVDSYYVYFKNEKIIERRLIRLVGKHNLENILAAICAAKLGGAKNEGIYEVLTTFSGVKHRLQFVDRIQNRLFYNDSKATNILATQQALSAFNQPIILLAGGLDRGNEFTGLLPYMKHVKAMVVFGETKEKLKQLAAASDIKDVYNVENVHEAAQKAYEISAKNDVILLSPACASWDQYKTFEERGNMFIQAVHTLV
ncbi:MAG TPA: UDP-N-acetylmuramoyl-L-alanine--D-glutamate ligase [Bacillota bacterium]|nr:UDP-N-acetylmuramoyl-L-alanine--D-glutamate ligase [Bacillota bacterium]